MNDRRPQVLVVDDQATSRELLNRILERESYQVVEAANGQEALEAVQKHPPDLILLDLLMPGLDGFGVLDRLKTMPLPFIPVIAVTVLSDRETRVKALAAGATEILPKPVDADEVMVRVASMLALKRAHDAAEVKAEELERAIAERTRELERALREREEAVEALEKLRGQELAAMRDTDRMKDQFLSVVSHELRTPLNFIAGFASVLQDEIAGPLTQTQQDYLAKIQLGADRMLGIVNNLMDASQVATGRFTLSKAPTDFEGMVRQGVSALEPFAAANHVAVGLDVRVRRDVLVDGQRLGQVVMNLLDNAIKFSPEGGTARVRARIKGDEVFVEVSDTGIGIAEQDLPHIFRPFTQVDMSETRSVGGVGLGLSISKSIVEAHGGKMGIISEPGKGSTFWFSVPAGPPAPGRQALVVEDEVNNRNLMVILLEDLGYVVTTATNGAEALQLCCEEKRTFDVILMDILMPVMDGLEATRRLRGCEQVKGAFIVAVTALANETDRKASLGAGADAYLSKPFTQEELKAALPRQADKACRAPGM